MFCQFARWQHQLDVRCHIWLSLLGGCIGTGKLRRLTASCPYRLQSHIHSILTAVNDQQFSVANVLVSSRLYTNSNSVVAQKRTKSAILGHVYHYISVSEAHIAVLFPAFNTEPRALQAERSLSVISIGFKMPGLTIRGISTLSHVSVRHVNVSRPEQRPDS